MDRQKIRELTDAQLNGELDNKGFNELETLLASDASARREYLRYVFLHGELACTEQVMRSLGERDLRPTPARPAAEANRLIFALAACLLVALGIASLLWKPAAPALIGEVATVTSPRVLSSPAGRPELTNTGMKPGTVRLPGGEARIRFGGGAEGFLAGPTVLGVASRDQGALFVGKFAAGIANPELPLFIETPGVRIIDHGNEFGVSVNDRGETEVHVFDGQIEIQSRVRLPRSYWTFDDADAIRDLAQGIQNARYAGSAKRTSGLVGSGAASFDDTAHAAVTIDVADAQAFKVSTGVTIEALIASRWTGQGWTTRDRYDYDEILRKEDGYQRILLSFQNDHGVVPSVPAYVPGPCLSFGLNLAGHSYSELDMPLDGKEGRPTHAQLCDGRLHHVVATYDSFSGEKTIYIDGQRAFSTKFPSGTLIVSGGTAPVMIGNLPAGIEPFRGLIDEVAFYDFALSAAEVAEHFARVQSGKNYFGHTPGEVVPALAGGWKSTTHLATGQAARFDVSTGRALGTVDIDRAIFATPGRFD